MTKRFYLQGEQIAGNSYYYACDHLGSVRELTDSSGTLRARYDYDLFGRRSANTVAVSPVEADFGYTGHYFHAASGLDATYYRFYDANLARWINRDPISEMGGINLYAYAQNNPLSLVDPFGNASSLFPYGTNAIAGSAKAMSGARAALGKLGGPLAVLNAYDGIRDFRKAAPCAKDMAEMTQITLKAIGDVTGFNPVYKAMSGLTEDIIDFFSE